MIVQNRFLNRFWSQLGVPNRVLNVPVPEVALNEPGVGWPRLHAGRLLQSPIGRVPSGTDLLGLGVDPT
jgi:hypothetical protein